jgi:nucleotide-binding universal stress UspA family protein
MWDKIIVPMDGSVTAEVALPYAIEFAGRTDSELVLIFVKEQNDYRSEIILQAYLDTLSGKAKEEAKQYLKEPQTSGLKTRTLILTGNPAEEILKFTEKNPNSRLIMASHGQSGFSTRWALGSVADKVTRASATPVTLIRAERDKPAIHAKGLLKTILAPVDGSKLAEATLPYIKEMARLSNATVIFLQVLQKELASYKMIEILIPEETRKAVHAYLEHLVGDFQQEGISAKYEVWETRGDIAGEIVEYTEKNNVDLVIMATHGHSGLKRLVLGSVSNKVMREGNAPIMLVRPPGDLKD